MADLDSPDPFGPASYGWSPEQEQLFADAMAQAAAQQPAPGEIEMPADNFASVTPAELDAARQAQGGEIEMPEDNFASVSPAELEAVRQEQAPPPPLPVGAWDPAVTAAPEMPAPPAPPAPPQALGATLPGVGVPLSLVPADPRTPAQRDLEVPVDAELEEAQRFERLSPEEQAREIQAYENQRASRLRADEAARDEERARDAERSRDNAIKARLSARQELQQINEEAQRLAQTEIDPDRYRKNRSAVSTILDVIAAAAGGLTQHLNGGRNLGLEMLERAIDRDIEAQKLNRAGQRAELERRSGVALEKMRLDEQDAREDALYRMTIYEAADRRAARDQAELDQRGTSHFRLAQIRQGIAARKQEALLGLEKARAEQIKDALDTEGKLLDLEKKRAELLLAQKKASGYGVGGRGVRKPGDAPLSEQDLRIMFPGAPDDVWRFVQARGGAASPKEVSAQIERSRDTAGARKAASEADVAEAKARLERSGPGGSPYAVALPDGTPITTAGEDGKRIPFEIKDDTKRNEALTLVDAAANITAFADTLTMLSKKYGGAWEKLNSDESQLLNSLANSINFETYKLFGLGAPSAGDQAMAEGVRGGDVLSFKNRPIAGLQQYARSVQQKVNTRLGTLGRRGPPIQFTRLSYQPAAETKEDKEFKAALATPAPGDVIEAARTGKQLVSPGRKFDDDLVVLPEVRRTIESLLATAKSGPASSRDEARIKLEKLYTDGPNEGVRNAAEAALLDLGKPAEVVDEPQQATARDGISQPRRVR